MRGEGAAGLLPMLSREGWPLLGPVIESLLLRGISRVLKRLLPRMPCSAIARLLFEGVKPVVSLAWPDMHELTGAPELAMPLGGDPAHGDHKEAPDANPWQDAVGGFENARSVAGDARRAYGSVCRVRATHGLRDVPHSLDPANPAAGQNGRPAGGPRHCPPPVKDPREAAPSLLLAVLRFAMILLRIAMDQDLYDVVVYLLKCILQMCGIPAG